MTNRVGYPAPVAREMTRGLAKYTVACWAAVMLIVAGAIAGISWFTPLTKSIVDVVVDPSRYWLLVMGIVLAAQLRCYVAVGVSRRAYARAVFTALVTMSGLLAVLLTVSYYAELLVYRAQGWQQRFGWDPDGPAGHIFTGGDQSLLVGAELFPLFLVHGLAGGLLTLSFYRFKAWGLVAIPVVLASTGLVELTLRTGWSGRLLVSSGGALAGADVLWIVVSIAVTSLGLGAAAWWMLRDVGINPKTG